MSIRVATSGDAAAIAAVWNPMIRETVVTFNSIEKTPQDIAVMIAQRQRAGHGFWVAEKAGQVAGFATYSQFRAGVGYAHAMEHTIILAPWAQGAGLGHGLMRTLEAHAKAQGAHTMIAGVCGENRSAQAFHAALGYECTAVIPAVGRKFNRWMDLHILQKFL